MILQITLTGLAIVFFNFFTMLYYDPMYLTEKQGAAGPPRWVYFTYVGPIIINLSWLTRCQSSFRWALGLFLYQSLDAIDGYIL